MSRFIKIGLIILAAYSKTIVKGQDMHFTQFYSSPLYLNPAFTGAGVCSRVSTTYRNQWPGITKTYKSYLVSADHYLQQYNIGIGLLFGNDVAGTGDLKTTIINPSIAYETKLSRKLAMRVGFQPGMGIRSINFNNLLFGDQIKRGGNPATLETPTQTKVYFDVGAGVLLYASKYWGGISFFHLNKPNESLMENEDAILPIKYTVHGGIKHVINKEEKEDFKKKSVSGAFHYRGQNEFDQFDIGMYYTQYVFNLGIWYRGIPFLKAYKPGYSNNDAVALLVGITTDRMNIGYSYDITISRLAQFSQGAHELCISYQLCKPKKKKKPRLLIPCPKF